MEFEAALAEATRAGVERRAREAVWDTGEVTRSPQEAANRIRVGARRVAHMWRPSAARLRLSAVAHERAGDEQVERVPSADPSAMFREVQRHWAAVFYAPGSTKEEVEALLSGVGACRGACMECICRALTMSRACWSVRLVRRQARTASPIRSGLRTRTKRHRHCMGCCQAASSEHTGFNHGPWSACHLACLVSFPVHKGRSCWAARSHNPELASRSGTVPRTRRRATELRAASPRKGLQWRGQHVAFFLAEQYKCTLGIS